MPGYCLSEIFSVNESQPAGPKRDPQALDGIQILGLPIQGADAMIGRRSEQTAFYWEGGLVSSIRTSGSAVFQLHHHGRLASMTYVGGQGALKLLDLRILTGLTPID